VACVIEAGFAEDAYAVLEGFISIVLSLKAENLIRRLQKMFTLAIAK
jgi:hypothetical protein